MFNRQSKIGNRKLINPLAAIGNEDRQLFHHELCFANGADHMRAGSGIPFFRHLFAGVTAPALDVSAARENTAIEFDQVAVVQPRFTSTIDVVAVIEHETRAIGMTEVLKTNNL